MAVSRSAKTAVAGATSHVTFEVERFDWVGDDRLEVAGRWFGLRGHRFLRPTLDVEVDGHHRRLLALLEHKPWAADDGEDWVAAFGWQGEPVQVPGAELAVGPDLIIELPAPAGGRPPRGEQAAASGRELLPAGRARAEIELELSAARDETERLAHELERLRVTHAARIEELQRRLTADREEVAHLKEELAAARAATAAVEARSSEQIEQLSSERDAAVAASSSALAETKKIESERDAALRARAAVEQERDAAVRARDSARQERNAWMSRARVAAGGKNATGTASVRRRPAAPAAPDAPAPAQAGPAPEAPARAASAQAASARAAAPSAAEPAQAMAADPADARVRRDRRSPRSTEDAPRQRRAPAPRAAAKSDRPASAATATPDDDAPTRPLGARPGVRTVRIGFDESRPHAPRSGAQDELATPLLAVPPGVRVGARRTVPLWAPRVLAALALVIAVAIIVLLLV
jgi:hypothetical protein